MKEFVTKDIAGYSSDIFIQKTDGTAKTGLTAGTTGLKAFYRRGPNGSAVQFSLAAPSGLTAPWASGNFLEVSASGMPGFYRVDWPDAMFASGVRHVYACVHGVSGTIECPMQFMLTDVDFLTLLSGIANSVWAYATGANLATNVSNILTRLGAFSGTSVNTVKGYLEAMMRNDAALPTDVSGTYQPSGHSLQAIVVNGVGGGSGDWSTTERNQIRYRLGIDGTTATPAATPTLASSGQALTILNRLPTALVSGRMDASVGAYQSGQAPLQPTVAGRTLDVSAGGEAGVDWANVGSPTTTVNLSNTSISGGGGGGGTDWTTTERNQIRQRLGIDGTTSAPTANSPTLSTAASLSAAQTDITTLLSRLSSGRAAALDLLDAAISTRATPAQVNAEMIDVLATDTQGELATVPAANASLRDKIVWTAMLARNEQIHDRDAGEVRLKNDLGTIIAEASVSTTGNTVTRGEWRVPS